MDLGEFNKFLAGFPIESEQQPPVAATENTIPDLDAQILALQKQKEDREKRQREMEERKAIQTIQIHSPGVAGEPIHNVLTEIKDVLVDLRQHLGTLMEREIHNTSYVYRTVKELKDIVKDHSLGVYLDIKPGVAPKGKNVTSRNMVTTGELTLSREAGGVDRLWTPFKKLQTYVDAAINRRQPDAIHDLEVALRRHKADFLTLLKSPPKNATHRDAVKKSTTVGIPRLGEQGTQTFTQGFIDEALILSDLFDMNEYAALELLITGEDSLPEYPGLTRGLVAVMLYYDGRRSLVSALRTLMQSIEGPTWTLGLSSDLLHLTNTFVLQLVEEDLTSKILDEIGRMDMTTEMDKLQNNRALGPPKHRKQVTRIYKEIKETLADSLFCLACQKPLNKNDTLRLIAHLREDNSLEADGSLTRVTLFLLMALLYCFNVSMLEQEDRQDVVQSMPILSDDTYVKDVHKELTSSVSWKIPGLKAVAQFGWGLALRLLSSDPSYPVPADITECIEQDEMLVDMAIEDQVFHFLLNSVVTVPDFHKEDFQLKRLHEMLTDFIFHMPLKVKDIRNRGDETARIEAAHRQEGQEPPQNLKRDFEHMLKLIGKFYSKDPSRPELALDYWCPPEPGPGSSQETYHQRPPQRQVALYKFVRMAGDLLPPSLFVPYIEMLTGLASSTQCAQHCYNLLKMNGGSSNTVSWDHIFTSLSQYYSNLRVEAPSTAELSHQQYRLSHSRIIAQQELEGLVTVLKLTRRIAEQSENCRVALCENQQWSVVMVMFGLVTCSVPAQMKAELLRTLAAFARTPEIASNLWQTLEASQVLVTVPGKQPGGIQVELDEIESRSEEYPMTRAFLEFLNVLTDVTVPVGIGAGVRAPGFDPYLEFIRDSVFLKFNTRAYTKQSEKWDVASSALEIMKKLLHNHEVQASDFQDHLLEVQGGGTVTANKPPGHTLLIHMLNDSRLFQMIVRLLDDAMKQLELYIHIPGQASLERMALLCLQMIEETMEKEKVFVDTSREVGSSIMITSMNKLLMGINPRTGKADHLINIAKYIMFNSSMPKHTLSAMKILYWVCRSAPIQTDLVNLFTENKDTGSQLLYGFVECLDVEAPEEDTETLDFGDNKDEEQDEQKINNATRQHLLHLLLHALDQPAPNLAHLLLGFELRKPVSKTNLQNQGVLNSPKTCLHSILTILSQGVGVGSGPQCLVDTPKLAELCFKLIYKLSANKDTSAPTLRYLRTSCDFLYRHLQALPYNQGEYDNPVSNHQSWLLKTLAVELRITSLNRQRSHTQRLMKLLLDDCDEEQTSVLQVVGTTGDDVEGPSLSMMGEHQLQQTQYGRTVRGRQTRRKLLSLLDSVDFHLQYPTQLQLEFFDPHLIQQVFNNVERKTDDGIAYYDVKALHAILNNELNNLQGTTMAGQRPLIMEEIERVLRMTVERNHVFQSLHSQRQAFESWRQVTEIVLTACPEDLLSGELRQTVLFELLQDLLSKVSDDDALTDLTAPVAGVILTLMANLRLCFVSEDQETGSQDQRMSQYISMLDKTQGTSQTVNWGQGSGSRTLFATSLQTVLKLLIEHILRSGGRQQRVRAKLYGALLYYLQIAEKPKQAPEQIDPASKDVENRLLAASDSEYDQLKKENISTILSYGDKFMDLVSADSCDGIDVGRMLALCVLDVILTMDKFQQWLSFLSSKGYLQHIVDSLAADDHELLGLLGPQLSNLKVMYLFESKMSLLTRVADHAVGAHTLLQCGIMQRLAACTFFDMRPEVDEQASMREDEDFLPDPMSRYRHLLFATLKLCLAILTSLGIENAEAGLQIMHFIVGHGDVFHAVLRDRQPSLNLPYLKELALTTGVIARANYQGEETLMLDYSESDSAAIEFRGHRARIQRQMIALLPKYCLSEKLNKQLKNLENQEQRDKKDLGGEITVAYLEVAANVTSYCRSLVSSSGLSAQNIRILFGPNMEEAMARDLRGSEDFSVSTLSPAQAPNLGVVVYQLKQCASHFLTVYDSRKQHLRKLEGLTELSSEDLKQFSGVPSTEKMSTQQRQLLAKKRLTQIVTFNSKELQSYSYIIENCLFLLWRHLEYYLVHCVPVDQRSSLYQTQARRQQQIRRLQDVVSMSSGSSEGGLEAGDMEDLKRGVSQQELDALKKSAVSVLSDSLFTKIQEINKNFSRSRTHYGFVEAVIRRIKRLLRLNTGSWPSSVV